MKSDVKAVIGITYSTTFRYKQLVAETCSMSRLSIVNVISDKVLHWLIVRQNIWQHLFLHPKYSTEEYTSTFPDSVISILPFQ